jgi:hypothetical protein
MMRMLSNRSASCSVHMQDPIGRTGEPKEARCAVLVSPLGAWLVE